MPLIPLELYVDFEGFCRRELPGGKLCGDEWTALCRFHDDKKASFSMNTKTGVWNCLAGCGGGNFVHFVARIRGVKYGTAFKMVCQEYNIPRNAGKENGNGKPGRGGTKAATINPPAKAPAPAAATGNVDDLFIPEEVWEAFGPIPEADLGDLEKARGWSQEAIKKLDIRRQTHRLLKTGEWKEFNSRCRIAIPIRDAEGRLRNIRLYHPNPPDRRNEPGVPESKIFSVANAYGSTRNFPAAPLEAEGMVYLCEGEPDAICAISKGLNAITHTGKLDKYPKDLIAPFVGRHVVICYDADKPGQIYALKAAKELLGKAKSVKILKWPDFMGRQENGEWPDKGGQDMTDFFVRHGKSIEDFHALEMIEFTAEDAEALKAEQERAKRPKNGNASNAMTMDQAIAFFNSRHAVVMLGGKCCVLNLPAKEAIP